MPITVTLEIPDDMAVRVAALTEADLLRLFLAGLEADTPPAVASNKSRRSIRDFAGVGAGRPGAVGGDVEEHIRTLRDEWDEREQLKSSNRFAGRGKKTRTNRPSE